METSGSERWWNLPKVTQESRSDFPSTTQGHEAGCEPPPPFRANPEAMPGAPADPEIEPHCHIRHPGDMRRLEANSRTAGQGRRQPRHQGSLWLPLKSKKRDRRGGHQTKALAARGGGGEGGGRKMRSSPRMAKESSKAVSPLFQRMAPSGGGGRARRNSYLIQKLGPNPAIRFQQAIS